MRLATDQTAGSPVDRIVDVRHERDGGLVGERHDCVRQAFFGAAQAKDLAIGVGGDAEPALHEVGGRASELIGAAKGRVAVCARIGEGVGNGLDDRRGRRLVRIPHPEVDEVGATGAGVGFELVEPGEDVGGKVGQPPGWNQFSWRGRRLFVGACGVLARYCTRHGLSRSGTR